MSKPLIIGIVAVVVILGGWLLISKSTVPSMPNSAPTAQESQTFPTTGGEQNTVSEAVTASNSSDTVLDSDLNNINAQLINLDYDNANADRSMDDKPIAQESF